MKSNPSEDSFHHQLGDVLRADAAAATACDEPDAVLLAEYLEGSLDEITLQDFEAHLAGCPTCRQLAMESAALLGEPEDTTEGITERTISQGAEILTPSFGQPKRNGSGVLWPLVIAAGLAALTVRLWWSPTEAPGISSDLSPNTPAISCPSDVTAPSTQIEPSAPIERALAGQLRPISAFADLLGEERQAVRRVDNGRGAQPTSPRWSLIADRRPVFRWYPETTASSGLDAEVQGEILLVDAQERLVANIPIASAVETGNGQLSLPFGKSEPPLLAGELYAWKVNQRIDGEILASDYVPFQIIEDELPLEGNLSNSTASSLDRPSFAAMLADAGRLDEALQVLSILDSKEDFQTAEALLEAIFEHQHLAPEIAAKEKQRMGWPTTPPPEPVTNNPGKQP